MMSQVHHSYRWQIVRRQALARDGYKCGECGVRGRLSVHHVKSARKHPELVFDLDNCISLCKNCHASYHTKKKELREDQRKWQEYMDLRRGKTHLSLKD